MKIFNLKKISVLIAVFFISTCLHAVPPVAKGGNHVINPSSSTTLNLLKECSFEGSSTNVSITITTQPQYGTATVIPTTKMVVYAYKAGYSGKFNDDWFEYKITTGGEESSVVRIYLHPATKPDNMIDDVCHVDNPGFTWAISSPIQSDIEVVVARPWLIGDLDNNELSEIVVWKDVTMENLAIFKDGDVKDPYIFNVKTIGGATGGFNVYEEICNIGLSRFDNGKGAIVALNGNDEYIYAFEYDVQNGVPSLSLKYKSTVKWTHIMKHAILADNQVSGNNIGFADFDGDGKIEVYIGNKIFSLDGLQLLTSLGATDNQGFSFQYGHVTTTGGCSVSVAADVDKDGLPELIVGGKAYKVNRTGNTWSMNLYKTAPNVTINPFGGANITARNDGRTNLADFNGDGNIDVLISYTASTANTSPTSYCVLYGWDITNNQILFKYVLNGYFCLSYPLIGDIDGDGKLEIAATFQKYTAGDSYDAYLKAFKLPTTFGTNAVLTNPWTLSIHEAGCRTGISLFDFNLDGTMELVYRDMENLRILNATTNSFKNLLTTPSTSATTWEMPLVADIDNDGAAEIICASGTIENTNTGTMRVYRSGNNFNWAPARKVWNQYAYNPTFANDDMTIPRYPINMGVKLTDEFGVVRTPYNNFLQQAPIMNRDGVSLNAAPNLIFSASTPTRLSYNSTTDKMNVTFSVTNNGNAVFKGPMNTILYLYTQATSNYTKIGNEHIHGNASTSIGISETVNITYTINDFSTISLPSSYDRWYLAINVIDNSPNAPSYFYGAAECKEGDNLTSSISFVSKERIICEDDTEIIELPDSYSYKWYNSMVSTTPLTTVAGADNKLSVTKNASDRELFFVATYKKNDLSQPISQIRDTIFVYKTPDSLEWTGASNDGDWHDWNNWKKPDGVPDLYPKANVPRSCTNVLVGDAISNYPVLDGSATDYSDYSVASCNNITINHGGEVSNPDKLSYLKAYINVDFNANRWYMFSPPLKDFYSGDLYLNDGNPYLDNIFAYTKQFAKANPQNGYLVGDWTGNFNTPDVLFNAGEGFRLWISDKGNDPDLHPSFTFNYPKNDNKYHIYGPEGLGIWATYNITRTNSHRFIFDGQPNASGDFTTSTPGVSGTGVKAGELWLVGNPFMAHIDFTKFYVANSTKIKNLYRIMTDGGSYEYYNTGANTLPQFIAPMQSFIVEMRDGVSPVTSLTLNANMTLNKAGVKLKSANDEPVDESEKLAITLMNENFTEKLSQIFVIAENGAKNEYNSNEDISLITNAYTNPTDEPTVVYTQSVDNNPQMLSVNRLNVNNLDQVNIPLGIRSLKENQKINILIQGQWNFANNYNLHLYDKLTDTRYNLRENTWFLFKNEEAYQQNLNDRFVIEIGDRTISGVIENNTQNSNIIIYANGKSFEVKSSESSIADIYVYDLQGRLIIGKSNLNTNHYTSDKLDSGIYLIKTVSDKETFIKTISIN